MATLAEKNEMKRDANWLAVRLAGDRPPASEWATAMALTIIARALAELVPVELPYPADEPDRDMED